MKELSLNILDIAQNSITAGATSIALTVASQVDDLLSITIEDNGSGMSPDLLAQVTDPFTTTRTTRDVGMGLPLLREVAEQAGGALEIESTLGVGTKVVATFYANNIDCPPLGDMGGTVSALVQSTPTLRFIYTRNTPKGAFILDTNELREQLGEDVSLDEPAVVLWVRDFVREQEQELGGE